MTRRVLVVGAGPAGALAANLCARRGDEVVIVDRAEFPRDKACGDVVGPRALSVLAGVGIECGTGSLAIGEMDVAVASRKMTLHTRPGVGVGAYGVAARRRSFDAELLELALKAGATSVRGMVKEVRADPQGVSVHGEFGSLEAEYLIGADGANSTTASRLGLVDRKRAQFGFALRRYGRCEIDSPLVVLLARVGEMGVPGYGWIFPQGKGGVNVGVGVAVGSNRADAKGLRGALDAFCGTLESNFSLTVSEMSDELGGWLKMGMVGTISGRGRVLLVGDAAGVVNPFQGEGIASALESAVLASESLVNSPLDPGAWYRRALWERMGRFQSVGYAAQRLALSSPGLSESLLTAVVRVGSRYEPVAAGWGTFWNDLVDVAGPGVGAQVARGLLWGGWQVARRRRDVRDGLTSVRYGSRVHQAADELWV